MIIKNTLLAVVLLCAATISSYAQKVDLDRHYIKVNYTKLPTKPILDESLRTYAVNSNDKGVANDIKIFGFEKLPNEGTITVDINIGPVIIQSVDIKKREEVNKDKEGNVTSIKRFYKPVISYTTKGSYEVKNSAGEGYTSNLGGKKQYSGNEYSSSSKASSYYNNNSTVLKDQFRRDFAKDVRNTINGSLNRLYGYKPSVYNDLFWILDSKKNDDYEGHQKALADIKSLLFKVEHNKSLDDLKGGLKPLEDYFMSIIPKYSEDKKRHRKMKYASYYNLGRLYYHFDMPDKAIEMANKIIENDYDKSDGKKLIKECESLKKILATNKVTTRHFYVETVDNSGDSYSDVASTEEVAPKAEVKDKFIDVVYDKGDGTKIEGKLKLKGDIDESNLDLTRYHKNIIRIYYLNDEGEAADKGYFARENAFYKANGITYEAVKFAPNDDGSNDGVVSVGNSAKYLFTKVIYKGKKLSLYRYKNELVIKKAGDKKGQSTKSLAYAIGFKKKLSKLVADCPELAALAKDGTFTNDEDSLLAFVTQYNEECK